MTGYDPKRPVRQRQHACSSVVCSRHDDWCYIAELSFNFYEFQPVMCKDGTRYNSNERAGAPKSINKLAV